jgi:hypothetical protein
MSARRAVVVGGLLAAVLLFVASLALMPAHPEGPPRPRPWYLFYASLAVATLTVAAAGISVWRSGEGRRRDLWVRAALIAGVLATIALVGLAFRVYLAPPHDLVECARNLLPPHQLACSYHNRNTPLAHREAGQLVAAALAVGLGTLGVLGWAERRRLRLRHTSATAPRSL